MYVTSPACQVIPFLILHDFKMLFPQSPPLSRIPADAPRLMADPQFRQKLYRAMVRLAEESGMTPSTLFVVNITLSDGYHVAGGTYADIYKGMLEGQPVAVKRMRTFLGQSEDQLELTRKVN